MELLTIVRKMTNTTRDVFKFDLGHLSFLGPKCDRVVKGDMNHS